MRPLLLLPVRITSRRYRAGPLRALAALRETCPQAGLVVNRATRPA